VTPVPVEPVAKTSDKATKASTLKETDIASGAAAEPVTEPSKPANTPKPLAQPLTLASRTEGSSVTPDGTQELIQAQRYLDGRGVPHDSAVAASLLWKAVGKQNARADMLLADLYVRGEGVSKSCDQARLLLVAATKKSAPGAAEKLRNFEFSNCR
jgi:TPR repeat protein